MRASDCEHSINLPVWVPAAMAAGLALLVAIAVTIAYACQEYERHKNFYGREDKLSCQEIDEGQQKKEEDMVAIAYGRCTDELVVVPPSIRTPGAPGVRVMMRRKRAPTPDLRSTTPGLRCQTQEKILSPLCAAYNPVIITDKTNRGPELLNQLNMSFPVGSTPKHIADMVTQNVLDSMQKMTGKSYVVNGILNGKKVIIKGTENMMENVEEMTLQIKLSITVPPQLIIMAYRIGTESANDEVFTPVPMVSREPTSAQKAVIPSREKSAATPLTSAIGSDPNTKRSEQNRLRPPKSWRTGSQLSQGHTPGDHKSSGQMNARPEERTSMQNKLTPSMLKNALRLIPDKNVAQSNAMTPTDGHHGSVAPPPTPKIKIAESSKKGRGSGEMIKGESRKMETSQLPMLVAKASKPRLMHPEQHDRADRDKPLTPLNIRRRKSNTSFENLPRGNSVQKMQSNTNTQSAANRKNSKETKDATDIANAKQMKL